MEFDEIFEIYEPPALVELGDHDDLTQGGKAGWQIDFARRFLV